MKEKKVIKHKQWDGGQKFRFRHKTIFGIKNANIKIGQIYKFGIEYRNVEFTTIIEKCTFNRIIGIGYIITYKQRKYLDIHISNMMDLRGLIRQYGKYKVIKKKEVIFEDGTKRTNVEYVCKFNQTAKFKKLTAKRFTEMKDLPEKTGKWSSKTAEDWEELVTKRKPTSKGKNKDILNDSSSNKDQ